MMTLAEQIQARYENFLVAAKANRALVTCPCGGAHGAENHGQAPKCVCPESRLAESGHYMTCPVGLGL